ARLLDHRADGLDHLPFGGRQRARRLRLRRAGGDLDETHAAIAGDRQAFMVAEARNFLPRHLARLQNGRALRNVEFYAIYGNFRHYSAASNAPPFSRMRRSISGRKWRIRPWIGHAAASPSAQMVWPSTCLVTSNSVSISLMSASPVRSRSITRHIQPVPSRHGVHWPQLSCL